MYKNKEGKLQTLVKYMTLMINALECIMSLQLRTLQIKPIYLSQISLGFCIGLEND